MGSKNTGRAIGTLAKIIGERMDDIRVQINRIVAESPHDLDNDSYIATTIIESIREEVETLASTIIILESEILDSE